MEKFIGSLFFVACALCASITKQSADNGGMLIATMFACFCVLTAIGGMTFIGNTTTGDRK